MSRRKIAPVLRHGAIMVRRNLRSYCLLSVTIVLSFSLLLGYLGLTDTRLYNEYRDLFAMRRGDVLVHDSTGNDARFQIFQEQLRSQEGTNFYIYHHITAGHQQVSYTDESGDLPEGNIVQLYNFQLICLPDHAWVENTLLAFDADITWLGEKREPITLAADEAILSEGLFYALGLDKQDNPTYTFRLDAAGTMDLKIVGTTADSIPLTLERVTDETPDYAPKNYWNQIIASSKLLELLPQGIPTTRFAVVHSTNPEQVVHTAESLKYEEIHSVYEQQNEALEAIRLEKRNKAIIACALLLLLGVNLYSCFTNALNDRKFEIGVKRAIGASALSIVRQFLYESLIVMVTNIFLSVVLVADVFIVYKFLYEHTPNEWGQYLKWIIYISPQSVAMFAVCSVSLTLVFSLIFAYKSTQVEIVQYLKAE